MAKGYNNITVVGNLGRDPEGRMTSKDKAMAKFSVAVTTGFGEYEHTEWFNVVVYGNMAKPCVEYLNKGSKVLLRGELHTREYTDKEGVAKKIQELIARDIVFLDSKPEAPKKAGNEVKKPVAKSVPVEVSDEEDIPF